MIEEVLKFCKGKGWFTHYHKGINAWAVALTKKESKIWLCAIGLKPVDKGLRITFTSGPCYTFGDAEAANNYLEYQLSTKKELDANGFVRMWDKGVVDNDPN